jgi:hypothetical protein
LKWSLSSTQYVLNVLCLFAHVYVHPNHNTPATTYPLRNKPKLNYLKLRETNESYRYESDDNISNYHCSVRQLWSPQLSHKA